MKILIIDDNEQDRKVMERYLSKAGYADLLFAETGREGLEAALREHPAVVIVDTILPDTGGVEVCRIIKEAGAAAPKVIVITGSIDAVDAEKARKAGADDYVVKTSDFSPLIEGIKALLGEV